MRNTKPFFTIVTVSYNSASTISSTLDAMIQQSFHDFEYIVVDGASTDGTVDILREYEKKFKEAGIAFRWKSEPDQGIYYAMNKGILQAQGEYIGLINSDDNYYPDTLKVVHDWAMRYPEVDVFHGLMRFHNGEQLVMIQGKDASVLTHGMIEHPTCFVRREIYQRNGLFDTSYRYAADYDFMIRLYLKGCKFMLIDRILANYNENGRGNCHASRIEAIRIRRKWNLISRREEWFLILKDRLKKS